MPTLLFFTHPSGQGVCVGVEMTSWVPNLKVVVLQSLAPLRQLPFRLSEVQQPGESGVISAQQEPSSVEVGSEVGEPPGSQPAVLDG